MRSVFSSLPTAPVPGTQAAVSWAGTIVVGLLCRLRVVLPEAVGKIHHVPPESPPGRSFVLPDDMLSERNVWI